MDLPREQLNPDFSPLSVRCVHCGAESTYDMDRQNYHCLFCGGTTEIRQSLLQAEDWQERHRPRVRQQLWDASPALYRCPGCGAALLHPQSADSACAFCGSPLQRGALQRDLEVPSLLLPFVLSPEEARQALKAWTDRNRLRPEARRLAKALDRLEACYLPCHALQGPVAFQVSRADCQRQYHCRGYAEGVLVNASAQVDRLLLNAVEPFDWGRATPLTPEHLAQAQVKLPDLPAALLSRRTEEEVALRHLGAVESGLHSSDLQLQPDLSQTLCLPLLVPVYLLLLEDVQVLINGQTGRIAVRRDKPVQPRERLMEPLILSLLATLFWMYAAAGNLELFILATGASVVLIFALLGGQLGERLHRRLFRIRNPFAERYESRFFLVPGADAQPETRAWPLQFYESPEGEPVPVEIRRFTPKRLALFVLFALGVLALPWLAALLLTALRSFGGGEAGPGQVEAAYGAVWYVLAAAALFLGCLGLGRSLLFDHPVLRQPLPDGTWKAIPPEKSAPGRLSLWTRLRKRFRADAIVGIAFGALIVLLGSILAMLP